jgi:hypothetical protein
VLKLTEQEREQFVAPIAAGHVGAVAGRCRSPIVLECTAGWDNTQVAARPGVAAATVGT